MEGNKEVVARPISSPNQTMSIHVSQLITTFNIELEGVWPRYAFLNPLAYLVRSIGSNNLTAKENTQLRCLGALGMLRGSILLIEGSCMWWSWINHQHDRFANCQWYAGLMTHKSIVVLLAPWIENYGSNSWRLCNRLNL